MRILIVATPRSGSTELAVRLGRYLNLKTLMEPFSYGKWDVPSELVREKRIWEPPDNIVLKSLIHDVPKDYLHTVDGEHKKLPKEFHKITAIDFYEKYYKLFDKVILLKRRDISQQIQSWMDFTFHYSRGKVNEGIDYRKRPGYQKVAGDIIKLDHWLYELHTRIKIPFTYYEDLFMHESLKKQHFPPPIKKN